MSDKIRENFLKFYYQLREAGVREAGRVMAKEAGENESLRIAYREMGRQAGEAALTCVDPVVELFAADDAVSLDHVVTQDELHGFIMTNLSSGASSAEIAEALQQNFLVIRRPSK